MKDSVNATREFVNQNLSEEDAEQQAQADEATRLATFEFVKQLAAELSTGNFDLPPFPDVAIRVRDALGDPEVSVDSISRIVRSEPLLSARLLRMANSALLKRGTIEITDVKQAIGRMGFEIVRTAAVSMAMDTSFPPPKNTAIKKLFESTRQHSVAVSVYAFQLAKRHAQGVKPDDAMLAGLLHDIGRFYILSRATAFPDLFKQANALRDLMTDWHTGVGRAIIDSWGFQDAIAEAVDEHELQDREHHGIADLADVVLVANLLAHLGEEDQPMLADLPACKKLRLDAQACNTLVTEGAEEIRSMAASLAG